jgi:flagellar motor switch protein FliG
MAELNNMDDDGGEYAMPTKLTPVEQAAIVLLSMGKSRPPTCCAACRARNCWK